MPSQQPFNVLMIASFACWCVGFIALVLAMADVHHNAMLVAWPFVASVGLTTAALIAGLLS